MVYSSKGTPMTNTELALDTLQAVSGIGFFAKLGDIKTDTRQEQPKLHNFTTERDVDTARFQTKATAGNMLSFVTGDMLRGNALKIYEPQHP